MAKKSARAFKKQSEIITADAQIPRDEFNRLVRDRAYTIYLKRAGKSGTPYEDWLKAEKELMTELGLRSESSPINS